MSYPDASTSAGPQPAAPEAENLSFSRPLSGAVLLIGSLAWQEGSTRQPWDHARRHWRERYLDLKNGTECAVPVRYGRYAAPRSIAARVALAALGTEAGSAVPVEPTQWPLMLHPHSVNGDLYGEDATPVPVSLPGCYTMVLSNDYNKEGKLGLGLLYPLAPAITIQTQPDVVNAVRALSVAEGIYHEEDSFFTAEWGAVGVIVSPTLAPADRDTLLACWQREKFTSKTFTERFCVAGEAPCISPEGEVKYGSVLARSKYDFCLVTVTAPKHLEEVVGTQETRTRYPNAAEIAELVQSDQRRYFQRNRTVGISTSDDADIIRALGFAL